jgi:hypothetical protein
MEDPGDPVSSTSCWEHPRHHLFVQREDKKPFLPGVLLSHPLPFQTAGYSNSLISPDLRLNIPIWKRKGSPLEQIIKMLHHSFSDEL